MAIVQLVKVQLASTFEELDDDAISPPLMSVATSTFADLLPATYPWATLSLCHRPARFNCSIDPPLSAIIVADDRLKQCPEKLPNK